MQRVPIYKKKFWRDFRIEILRVRKDPHSRKSLMFRLGFLIYGVAVLCYYGATFYSFHDPATAIALAIVLAIMLTIIAANKYSQKREAQKQLAADFASVPRAVVAHVQRLAHGITAVTERGLGERWLTHNAVPQGHVAITRRITVDTLKQFGVWEEMPTEVRVWMMRPDGSWPPKRVTRVLATGELLNTLLWALGLQDSLRPVEDLLTSLSMKKLAKILKRPAPGIRPTWDLRLERDRAFQYFWRCYAERVHRNEVTAMSDEQAKLMGSWMEEISERPNEDFLAGAATVRELDGPAVWQATMSSAYRGRVLELLMRLLDGEEIWDELSEHVYACLLTPENEVA